MHQTEGIGSTFLAALFGTERRLKARGGHLALCQVGPFCAEVLEIVKADRVLQIFPDAKRPLSPCWNKFLSRPTEPDNNSALNHLAEHMENVIQDRCVTIVELDRNYDSLTEEPLNRLQGVLDGVAKAGDKVTLLIDMSRTTTINSSFIGMLFATGKQIKQGGGQLALCAADAFCSDVMRVVRLNQMFNTYPTRDEALEALEQRRDVARVGSARVNSRRFCRRQS